MLKRAFRWLFGLLAVCVVVIGLYLLAAWGAAYVRWSDNEHSNDGEKTNTIYLLVGSLHADIAIEARPELVERFDFLRQTALPLNSPDLRYLAFGWGSKEFYTTAGSYTDITLSATLRAITGDDAVMRVVALGDISGFSDNIEVRLTDTQLVKLLDHVRNGFKGTMPQPLNGMSIGQGDVFFAGTGHFNIFYPCNQWVNEGLDKAGVGIGVWTPTTYSLRQSLSFFGR